jgi:hypothetical protein
MFNIYNKSLYSTRFVGGSFKARNISKMQKVKERGGEGLTPFAQKSVIL